jgi:hypothetical protein
MGCFFSPFSLFFALFSNRIKKKKLHNLVTGVNEYACCVDFDYVAGACRHLFWVLLSGSL